MKCWIDWPIFLQIVSISSMDARRKFSTECSTGFFFFFFFSLCRRSRDKFDLDKNGSICVASILSIFILEWNVDQRNTSSQSQSNQTRPSEFVSNMRRMDSSWKASLFGANKSSSLTSEWNDSSCSYVASDSLTLSLSSSYEWMAQFDEKEEYAHVTSFLLSFLPFPGLSHGLGYSFGPLFHL